MKALDILSGAFVALSLIGCSGETAAEEGESNVVEASFKSGGESLPQPKTKADKMMVKYLDGLEEIAAAFQNVNDEAAAKALGATVEKIGARLNEMKPDWEKLTEAEISAAGARYSARLQELSARMSQSMVPLMTNPALSKHVQEAMQRMPDFMDEK